MKLVLAVPVNLRSVVRAVRSCSPVSASLLCLYLLFGFLGTLVLVAELFGLGALLRKAAHGK